MNSRTRIPTLRLWACARRSAIWGTLPVWGRVSGLLLCVRLTVTYLRHNLPRKCSGEYTAFMVSSVGALVVVAVVPHRDAVAALLL